ncbi:primase-helicase family protein [Microbulbifer sp. SAOS-129_SWC]|uniref:primase-helicase family protein n=1 Tax=Microbulbifer sp. SAOS-129_SWC TaxID=3145235 RepID=UPI0032179E52
MNKKSGIDFNDVHVAHGLGEVRRQLDAFMANVSFFPRSPSNEVPAAEAADPPPPESPAPSVTAEAREITLEDALKRFALISGTTKVWDEHLHKEMKSTAFRAEVGSEVHKQFMATGEKRKVLEQDVRQFIAARQAAQKGAGGVGEMLRRFTLLEGTEEVWDRKHWERSPLKVIKHIFPDAYDIWYRHPDRKMVPKKNVVFDPTRQADPKTHINTYQRLPLNPVRDLDACRNIRAMLWHLCNCDEEVWSWMVKWLAYPLQHVGSKLDSGLLMHSDMQGAGKSLFFDRVMREVYGEYSATLGQHQIESSYTDWKSSLLWGVFEEIFSRDKKYSQMGNIKQMITGATTRIEKKFVSGWEEANYMNSVFLSNELLPFPVEPRDRRFLVVWPKKKLPGELKKGVDHELVNGGPAAFYGWLLDQDLGDFHSHTEPPMTEAKERLISFGLPSWEVFYREWSSGELDAPYHTCLTGDLYQAYRKWCRDGGFHQMDKNRFSECLAARVVKRNRLEYDSPGGYGKGIKKDVQGTFFLLHERPADKTQKEWLSECVKAFRDAIGAFHEVDA